MAFGKSGREVAEYTCSTSQGAVAERLDYVGMINLVSVGPHHAWRLHASHLASATPHSPSEQISPSPEATTVTTAPG